MVIRVIDDKPQQVTPDTLGYISTGDDSEKRVTVARVPARRFVDILRFDTVTRVRRTYSTSDGRFRVNGLELGVEHCVTGRENRHARIYNDVIRGGIYPVDDS